MAKPVRILNVIAINAVVVIALLMMFELGLYVLMSRSVPTGIGAVDELAQQIYWSRVNYIQYDRDCSRYDAKISYTLNPGTCTFANDGFSTRVDVNSAGLRDDEASLLAPEIIFTGDSHTMGWGVEHDATFAQLIQEATGKPTLNAAISSYGTAREMMMLQRLDLSALQTLVVQYSENDAWENHSFLEDDRKLPIQSAASYAENVEGNTHLGYFPGAYLSAAFKLVVGRFAPAGANAPAASNELTVGLSAADKFLRILRGADLRGARVNLVLLEISIHGRGDSSFIDAALQSPELADLDAVFETVTFIKTHDFLEPEDRLFPDGHMNASGHRKVAEAVLQVLSSGDAPAAPQGTSK